MRLLACTASCRVLDLWTAEDANRKTTTDDVDDDDDDKGAAAAKLDEKSTRQTDACVVERDLMHWLTDTLREGVFPRGSALSEVEAQEVIQWMARKFDVALRSRVDTHDILRVR